MDQVSKSPISTLPNELLAPILKQTADSDLPRNSWETAPAALLVSQVSGRWRAVSLAYPELWTTIRISHRVQSQRLAALFMQRSGACLLDISIDLEVYTKYRSIECIPLDAVLHIVAPHVGRWRTVVLRAVDRELQKFSKFLDNSPIRPSRLTHAHLSSIQKSKTNWFNAGERIPRIFAGDALETVILNSGWNLDSLKSLRRVDIETPHSLAPSAIRDMLGSMLHVTTLVLRDFSPMPNMAAIRVQAPTIRSMSIDFADDWWYDSPLEFLTSTFNVPNLEYLELFQAFPPLCSISEFPYGFRLPPEWELEPQFPHLRFLRLKNTALTPGRLALLQVLTHGISELELVDTGGFHRPGRLYRRTAVQLNNSDDEYHLFPVESFDGKVDIPWPSLRSLTIDDVEIPAWISEFITVRAELGQDIGRVTLLPKPYPHVSTFAAPILRNTEIRRHPTRPSLIDSSPPGFFASDADFGHNGPLNDHAVESGDHPPSHAIEYPNYEAMDLRLASAVKTFPGPGEA